jgi:hypothetical protein
MVKTTKRLASATKALSQVAQQPIGTNTVLFYGAILLVVSALVFILVGYMQQQPTSQQPHPYWSGGIQWVQRFLPGKSNDINNIYKPPIQDNLDRYLGVSHIVDSDTAPNQLSTLRSSLAPSMDYLGETSGYGLDRARVARTLLPTHVRPPIDSHYKQVGILVKADADSGANDTNSVLPLMGQYLNNDKWRYFTMLSGNLQTKLPIKQNKKSCTSEYGCPELDNDANVSVAGLGAYNTTLYENGTFWA